MARRRPPKWLEVARGNPSASRQVARTDWLARALARAGVMPQAHAEAAIREGRVRLSGRVTREPLTLVKPDDRVEVDGRPVSLVAPTIVLAFHKPPGTVVSKRDPEGRQTVFDLLLASLPEDLRGYGWHAVGRLDRDTTGLLLFTNDERFVAFATLPKTHLPKRYVAEVGADVDEAKLAPLTRGVELRDGATRPAQVRIRAPRAVEITLTEGRHHQVKRMLGAVKLPVTKLHRESIGSVVVDVPEGAWRKLSDEEVRALGYLPREPPGSEPRA